MFKLLYVIGGFIAGKLYVEHKVAIKQLPAQVKQKLAAAHKSGKDKIADMTL